MADEGLAAVLFDMDGLLVDTEPLWFEVETEVMGRLGGAAWTAADQSELLGGSIGRTVSYLLSKAAIPAPPEVVRDWMIDGIVGRIRTNGAIVQPGARELHAEITAAGVPVALVTSSLRVFAEAVLAATGFAFDETVCADDVGATKPDPEPYLLAAKRLSADPAQCVALEDSPNGTASAVAAGCQVIAVPSFVPIDPAPGLAVVSSLGDLSLPRLRALVA